MAGASAQPEKIGEVMRLATLAAERILEAQVTDRPPCPELFTALVGAAQLLEEHNAPWPPLVEQVLLEAGRRFSDVDASAETAAPDPEDGGAFAGLTRFFSGFRRN
jgi:hypothetical protein